MTMLDVALQVIGRGWATFPCVPGAKNPIIPREKGGHGYKDATTDEAQVRAWWADYPNANVPIATGASGLFVVDIDEGIRDEAHLKEWMREHGLPMTYAVRSGHRPDFRVHLYYSGVGFRSVGFERDGCKGDIRCSTGLVIAAGGLHKSGEAYTVLWDLPIVPAPEYAKTLTVKAQSFDASVSVSEEKAEEWHTWLLEYADRNGLELTGFESRVDQGYKMGIVCPWWEQHTSGSKGSDSSTVLLMLDGLLSFKCSHGTCEAHGHTSEAFKQLMRRVNGEATPEPGAGPTVTLGTGQKDADKPKPPGYPRTLRETLEAETDDVETHRESMIVNWRGLFHTKDDVLNCPEPTYFIQDFLQHEAICGIAAPVGQRKSLIALNVARSLCTGEPLFGFLPVVNKPSRVLYLCPEMGLISMSQRTRNAGLTECLGDTLLLRSMNFGGLDLMDLNKEALKDSVLILDTAIRFVEGDENSAKDMRVFSDMLFGLQRLQGPRGAIIILYHSPKTTKDAFELTLENCLRGSGELGASLTDCWGTRMQEPEKGWDSLNFISHVKVRDYAGPKDFEVLCDKPTGIMSRVGNPDVAAVLLSKKPGQKANRDGMDEAARAFIKAHPDWKVGALISGLAELGIVRRKTWVTEARLAIRGGGSKLTE